MCQLEKCSQQSKLENILASKVCWIGKDAYFVIGRFWLLKLAFYSGNWKLAITFSAFREKSFCEWLLTWFIWCNETHGAFGGIVWNLPNVPFGLSVWTKGNR